MSDGNAAPDNTPAAEGQNNAAEPAKVEGQAPEAKTLLGGATAEGEPKAAETQEGKDAKPKEGEAGKPAEAAKPEAEKPGAPEGDYEAFKVPEGLQVDTELMAEAQPLFKAWNLPQAEAQKAIDLAAKLVTKAQSQIVQQWTDHQAELTKQVKADPDLGGAKLEATLALAAKGIDLVLATGDAAESAAIRKALDDTGAGNYPALVKAFSRLGRLAAEGKFVQGAPNGRPLTTAEKLYGRTSPA